MSPDKNQPNQPILPPARVRIAGKVMLSGEYAVLREAPAVMLPVPREMVLEVQPPALETELSPVVYHARRCYLPQVSSYEKEHGEPGFLIDDSEFKTTDAQGLVHKLGLGSSSAEAVGVIALRYVNAGLDWKESRERVCHAALDAHERAQGGIGSGADVAACAYGVPLSFRRSLGELQLRPIPEPEPSARVPLALVWSGVAADSRRLVERYLTWRSLAGLEGRNAEQYLQREAEELAGLWFKADKEQLFEAIDVYCQTMQAIADEAELAWRLPVHARLEAWAKRHGGRAKPTGAGGGDMVLLIGELPLDKLGLPTIRLDYAELWSARATG